MNTLSSPLDLPTLAQEQINEEEQREDAPKQGRRLTQQEWAEIVPPFVHMSPQFTWSTTQYEIALKFVASRASGWWYYNDRMFVFEKTDDAILFKMWASENPLEKSMGAV